MLQRRYILTHKDGQKEKVWLMGGAAVNIRDDETAFRIKHNWLFKSVAKGELSNSWIDLYKKTAELDFFLSQSMNRYDVANAPKKEVITQVDANGKYIQVKWKYLKPEAFLSWLFNGIYFRFTGRLLI